MKHKFTTKQLKSTEKKIRDLRRQLNKLADAVENEQERIENRWLYLDQIEHRTQKQHFERKQLNKYLNQLENTDTSSF